MPQRPLPLAALATVLTYGAVARGDGGFALNKFEPAPAGDVFFGVPSPFTSGHLDPRVHTLFDYAHRPVRIVGGDVALVSAQAFIRLDASFTLFDRLMVSADLPLAVLQHGEDPAISGTTFTALEAPKIGDVRLGLRGRLFGDEGGPLQLGVGGYLYTPSGSAAHYTGDGAFRGQPQLLVGGRVGDFWGFGYAVMGGAELHTAAVPQSLVYGAGAAFFVGGDTFQVGPELYGVTPVGATPLTLSATPVSAATQPQAGTNLELWVSSKLRLLRGLTVGAAFGPGLLSAVGTPTFRAMGMLGWAPLAERKPSPEPKPKPVVAVGDRDDDGINDDIDACPDAAGEPSPDPTKDGCPPPDRDGDGVLDVDDACPATAGERSVEATSNGCPPDGDGDGIRDAVDACPEVAGTDNDDPAKKGCPGDGDGDGVLDGTDACPAAKGPPSDDPELSGCPDDPDRDGVKYRADACPDKAGEPSSDPKLNGCPRFVTVTEGEILINKQILFVSDGSKLHDAVAASSFALLDEVKRAILEDASILRVEVQGHTDDNGDEAYNQELSQKRAEAVREWLVGRGVPADKLVAKGYGFERPIADNRHWKGRMKNRRVEFVILERAR